MAAPKIVEHAPGAMPDVRTEGDSSIYHMDVRGAPPPRSAGPTTICDVNLDRCRPDLEHSF